MDKPEPTLLRAPIVEAVLDIDCDLPPTQDLAALEPQAVSRLKDTYPTHDRLWLQEHRIETKPEESSTSFSSRPAVQAIRFHQNGGKQIVQIRSQGYSFNRLAPYTALDAYLKEIERTWRIYVGLAEPARVKQIRLRYINRILLPMRDQRVDLDQYLQLGPRVADENNLDIVSFFNQYTAVEPVTRFQVEVTLTLQGEVEGKLPVIFDNCALSLDSFAPEDWKKLSERIAELRNLKNRVFKRTLTERCMDLFRTAS